MWRVASIGLVAAVLFAAGWHSAGGETTDPARISVLETQVADLQAHEMPDLAPASIVAPNGIILFQSPWQFREYCKVTPYGPTYINTVELLCMFIDPTK